VEAAVLVDAVLDGAAVVEATVVGGCEEARAVATPVVLADDVVADAAPVGRVVVWVVAGPTAFPGPSPVDLDSTPIWGIPPSDPGIAAFVMVGTGIQPVSFVTPGITVAVSS